MAAGEKKMGMVHNLARPRCLLLYRWDLRLKDIRTVVHPVAPLALRDAKCAFSWLRHSNAIFTSRVSAAPVSCLVLVIGIAYLEYLRLLFAVANLLSVRDEILLSFQTHQNLKSLSVILFTVEFDSTPSLQAR